MSDPETKTNSDEIPLSEEGWQPKDVLIAIIAFAVIVAIAVGVYYIYQSQKPEPVVEGDVAPDFTLPLLDGGEDSLSNHKGEVVLLNIWATWCGPCRQEMPYMQDFYESMEGKPFVILAASQDRKGEEEVRPFVNEFGLTFPILLDQDKEVGDLYQTDKFPESYIIDKDGIIVKRVVGQLTNSDLKMIEHMVDN